MRFNRGNRWMVLAPLVGLISMLLIACSATPADETVETPGAAAKPETQAAEAPSSAQTNDGDSLLSAAGAPPVVVERDSDVPGLPFEDNPDPALCGIPQSWDSDEPAYLSGAYEGKLIQPIVLLYDSHLRRSVVAKAPHGSEIKILLSQSNPKLNYFMVKVVGAAQPNEGWVPAPFVSFEPPPPAGSFEPVAEAGDVVASLEEIAAPAPTGKSLQPQLAQADIDLNEVVTLLPPDAIPAIAPEEVSEIMVTVEVAENAGIPQHVRVIGVSINGESHAYPIPFLSRHEIVNAELGGELIAATW